MLRQVSLYSRELRIRPHSQRPRNVSQYSLELQMCPHSRRFQQVGLYISRELESGFTATGPSSLACTSAESSKAPGSGSTAKVPGSSACTSADSSEAPGSSSTADFNQEIKENIRESEKHKKIKKEEKNP